MATGFEEGSAWREQLSALVDGELHDASSLCAAWREDSQVRATWHAYHLIGDVLRSDDLAGSPARDALLLARVRERLAREPVVLAPAGRLETDAARDRRPMWRAAGAVAAGFVAVAGVYTLMRPAADAPSLSASLPDVPVVARADSFPPAGASQVAPFLVTSEPSLRLVRDARLDAYLAAHKQFAGSSAIGLPVYARPTVDSSPSDGR